MSCIRNILGFPLHVWGERKDDSRAKTIPHQTVEHALQHNISLESLDGDIKLKQIRRCTLCNAAQLRTVRS